MPRKTAAKVGVNKISASLLAADHGQLTDEIRRSVDAGIDWFHVDIMDGQYVPNVNFSAQIVELVAKHAPKAVCDVHLMVERPENHIGTMISAGADFVSFHAEATNRAQYCINLIKKKKAKAAMAISPATPISMIEAMADQLDMILIMTVEPGYGGQKLIEGMYAKVKRARELLDSHSSKARVEVDGGVTVANVARLADAGADTFVAGSSLYGNKDLSVSLGNFKQALEL